MYRARKLIVFATTLRLSAYRKLCFPLSKSPEQCRPVGRYVAHIQTSAAAAARIHSSSESKRYAWTTARERFGFDCMSNGRSRAHERTIEDADTRANGIFMLAMRQHDQAKGTAGHCQRLLNQLSTPAASSCACLLTLEAVATLCLFPRQVAAWFGRRSAGNAASFVRTRAARFLVLQRAVAALVQCANVVFLRVAQALVTIRDCLCIARPLSRAEVGVCTRLRCRVGRIWPGQRGRIGRRSHRSRRHGRARVRRNCGSRRRRRRCRRWSGRCAVLRLRARCQDTDCGRASEL